MSQKSQPLRLAAIGSLMVSLFAGNFQQVFSASGLSQMLIDSISCDFIKPVSKLLFIALEVAKIFNNFEENLSRNIFGCVSFKKAMYAVAKYRIIVPAI